MLINKFEVIDKFESRLDECTL